MKYIDAGRLKELLDAKYKEFTEKAKKDCPLQYQYMADGLDIAEQVIDSLQQEQPEVDLKKEIITQWSKCNPTDEGMGSEYAIITVEQFDAIARHFYELSRKQVLQEIYDGKTKPVDKITAAWLDDKEEGNK